MTLSSIPTLRVFNLCSAFSEFWSLTLKILLFPLLQIWWTEVCSKSTSSRNSEHLIRINTVHDKYNVFSHLYQGLLVTTNDIRISGCIPVPKMKVSSSQIYLLCTDQLRSRTNTSLCLRQLSLVNPCPQTILNHPNNCACLNSIQLDLTKQRTSITSRASLRWNFRRILGFRRQAKSESMRLQPTFLNLQLTMISLSSATWFWTLPVHSSTTHLLKHYRSKKENATGQLRLIPSFLIMLWLILF